MKYLITGNLGYVGPILTKFIKENDDEAYIIGYDIALFSNSQIASELTNEPPYVDMQIYGDVRNYKNLSKYVEGIDHVIHLAAVSNDPMGKEFESVTKEINQDSSVFLAKESIKNNCKSFVFASSCSVYGAGKDTARSENDEVNPLTAYAKSKIGTEEEIKKIEDFGNTKISCLRFATACGYSPNLRLDLVLNDFVATAINTKNIEILSDGKPWRPLIDVLDMARALFWACIRDKGENLEIINIGSPKWNYKIIDLANSVKSIINENVSVRVNSNAVPDKRSYKVDFDKFYNLAPSLYTPKMSLEKTVKLLLEAIKPYGDRVSTQNRKYLIRLNVLRELKNLNIIDNKLNWKYKNKYS